MSTIDDQIADFYNNMASLSLELDDYVKWIKSYEEQREKYPDWVTREGKHIKVEVITDSHLESLIPFVYRKDPDNETHWLDVLKGEKKYRELKKKLPQMRNELDNMREVSDMCF